MLLRLGKTNSPNNVMSKDVADWVELLIRLKNDVDVLAPVLVLRGEGLVLRDYNYAHIPDLGRYYFIRGVESVNGKLWRLELEVDVLESYRTQLGSCVARLWREVRMGDYYNAEVDRGTRETVGKFMSNVTLDADAKTNVLTVVSGGEE